VAHRSCFESGLMRRQHELVVACGWVSAGRSGNPGICRIKQTHL